MRSRYWRPAGDPERGAAEDASRSPTPSATLSKQPPWRVGALAAHSLLLLVRGRRRRRERRRRGRLGRGGRGRERRLVRGAGRARLLRGLRLDGRGLHDLLLRLEAEVADHRAVGAVLRLDRLAQLGDQRVGRGLRVVFGLEPGLDDRPRRVQVGFGLERGLEDGGKLLRGEALAAEDVRRRDVLRDAGEDLGEQQGLGGPIEVFFCGNGDLGRGARAAGRTTRPGPSCPLEGEVVPRGSFLSRK